jgi:hypothetical protein
MNDALTKVTPAAITTPEPRASQTIAMQLTEMARDKTLDVTKLEALLKMQREMAAEEQRTAFRAALARLQSQIGQLSKAGVIETPSGRKSRFLRLEDIDNAVRPLLAAEGFSLSFDSTPGQGNMTTYTATLAHCDGHAETKTLALPIDTGAGRNAVQSMGSSVSYARRYLIEMHLNIVKKGEDDDGGGGPLPLTEAQLVELKTALGSGDERAFLAVYGGTWDAISQRNFKAALGMIQRKNAAKVKP